MPNTNCLQGMKCPECGALEPFKIAISTIATVYDDGTEEFGDTEWDDDSYCECGSCSHSGIVEQFRGGKA